jgi:hypothetical protein
VAVNEGHATAVYGGLPSARRAIDHVYGLLRFVSVIEGSLRRNPTRHMRRTAMPRVPKRITDDTIKVRQLSHYQFTWVAGDPQENGTFTLQLVLDEGAWEEVVAVTAEDAEVLQALLKR